MEKPIKKRRGNRVSRRVSLRSATSPDMDPLALLDVLPILVWRSGLDARCDYFNQAWLEFTGRRLEQELGDGWAEGVHPDDRERCVSDYLDAFAKRTPFTLVYRLRHRDGRYRCIHDVGHPILTPRGEFSGYIGGCIDVTARVTAMAALDGALDQRERLLRDLHDSVLQKIFAIGIGLECVRLSIGNNPDTAVQQLGTAVSGLNEVVLEIRAHICRLPSKDTSNLQLGPEINALVQAVGAAHRTRFRIEVDSRAASRLSPAESTQVLSIVREAISNSVRHSGGTRGLISLKPRRDRTRVVIEDNGRGFDARRENTNGSGLRNIAARARELSARLDVRSNRRRGTRITVDIPLRQRAWGALNQETPAPQVKISRQRQHVTAAAHSVYGKH